MRRFIRNILVFSLLIVTSLLLISSFSYFVIGSQYKYNYQASLIDKVARLKSIDEPKIILVGNSNLSFGINSEMMEAELGMPVVNLGLHGGLGNVFHEQIAKLDIDDEDIVIVCHSSYSDDDNIGDKELALITYDYNNQLLPIFRKKDYIGLLKAYPTYLRKSAVLWMLGRGNQDEGGCYSRKAFNKYGDVVVKPEYEQVDVDLFFEQEGNRAAVPWINDVCMERLNALNQYCNDHGAKMVVAGYPVAYGKYDSFGKDDFIKFQRNLEDALSCDVISDFTDYFYPYDYFYNTALHLNDKGREARTKQLIEDMKKWMDEQY